MLGWIDVRDRSALTGYLLRERPWLVRERIIVAHSGREFPCLGTRGCCAIVRPIRALKRINELTSETVYECAMRSVDERRLFEELLLEHPTVSKHLKPEEIKCLLDPRRYVGLAGTFVDRVLELNKSADRAGAPG